MYVCLYVHIYTPTHISPYIYILSIGWTVLVLIDQVSALLDKILATNCVNTTLYTHTHIYMFIYIYKHIYPNLYTVIVLIRTMTVYRLGYMCLYIYMNIYICVCVYRVVLTQFVARILSSNAETWSINTRTVQPMLNIYMYGDICVGVYICTYKHTYIPTR